MLTLCYNCQLFIDLHLVFINDTSLICSLSSVFVRNTCLLTYLLNQILFILGLKVEVLLQGAS